MKPRSVKSANRLVGAEGLGHERALRPGVDLLDDRVLLARVEVLGPADDAPDVRLAVAPLGDEHLGRLPAARLQGRRVRLFELAYQLAVGRSPQLVDRGLVHPAVGIDQIAAIGRILHLMAAVSLGQRDQAAAVEIDAVVVDEIRVLVGVLAAGVEPDLPLRLRRSGRCPGRRYDPLVIGFLTAPVLASIR